MNNCPGCTGLSSSGPTRTVAWRCSMDVELPRKAFTRSGHIPRSGNQPADLPVEAPLQCRPELHSSEPVRSGELGAGGDRCFLQSLDSRAGSAGAQVRVDTQIHPQVLFQTHWRLNQDKMCGVLLCICLSLFYFSEHKNIAKPVGLTLKTQILPPILVLASAGVLSSAALLAGLQDGGPVAPVASLVSQLQHYSVGFLPCRPLAFPTPLFKKKKKKRLNNFPAI